MTDATTRPVTDPAPVADLLRGASQRLVRTVDSLADDDWAEPSLLPGWTRADVVAHLALNAEGLGGAVLGVLERQPVPMYESEEARDADIAALAETPPRVLRDRLLAGVTRLADALDALLAEPAEVAETRIERTPGSGTSFKAQVVPLLRLREVEVHHVDLDRGYSPADWPAEFPPLVLDLHAGRWRGRPGFTAAATDLGRSWTFGEPGPTVTGPAAALAWWVTGRPPYPGAGEVTSDDGALPGIEAL